MNSTLTTDNIKWMMEREKPKKDFQGSEQSD